MAGLVAGLRTGDTLRATIRRPVKTLRGGGNHAATAREDVEALLATVRRRTGLPDHPPLD